MICIYEYDYVNNYLHIFLLPLYLSLSIYISRIIIFTHMQTYSGLPWQLPRPVPTALDQDVRLKCEGICVLYLWWYWAERLFEQMWYYVACVDFIYDSMCASNLYLAVLKLFRNNIIQIWMLHMSSCSDEHCSVPSQNWFIHIDVYELPMPPVCFS